jgi:DNA-binding NarL/FixJ family response regulator
MNADAGQGGDVPDLVPGAESAPPVHVFAVDDHPAFLRSIMSVVAASTGFELVGTATTGSEALDALCARHDIDLVLLDVHLPDISGIEVARRCAEQGGGRVIVLMSTTDPDDLPADALSGVAGFLPKEQLSTATLRSLWFDAIR